MRCSLLCIALHCSALRCVALHCTALHCIAQQCTALHSIVSETAANQWPPMQRTIVHNCAGAQLSQCIPMAQAKPRSHGSHHLAVWKSPCTCGAAA
eukprot:893992-Alexandrium_andersonii.AAC.1